MTKGRWRGAADVFVVLVLLLVIAISVAWWVKENQGAITTKQNFTADPVFGTTPLSVTFSVRRDQGTVQTVDYGDGTIADTSDFICGLTYCTRVHLYKIPGTYTATFEDPSNKPIQSFKIEVSAAP